MLVNGRLSGVKHAVGAAAPSFGFCQVSALASKSHLASFSSQGAAFGTEWEEAKGRSKNSQ